MRLTTTSPCLDVLTVRSRTCTIWCSVSDPFLPFHFVCSAIENLFLVSSSGRYFPRFVIWRGIAWVSGGWWRRALTDILGYLDDGILHSRSDSTTHNSFDWPSQLLEHYLFLGHSLKTPSQLVRSFRWRRSFNPLWSHLPWIPWELSKRVHCIDQLGDNIDIVLTRQQPSASWVSFSRSSCDYRTVGCLRILVDSQSYPFPFPSL